MTHPVLYYKKMAESDLIIEAEALIIITFRLNLSLLDIYILVHRNNIYYNIFKLSYMLNSENIITFFVLIIPE